MPSKVHIFMMMHNGKYLQAAYQSSGAMRSSLETCDRQTPNHDLRHVLQQKLDLCCLVVRDRLQECLVAKH